ncbi:MAG: GNAT family N-acetyltransferase [Jatrophihabitans sp.]|nr:MAG: GNAT family N-acetyltransferase [Jatrophihabitans sp.]
MAALQILDDDVDTLTRDGRVVHIRRLHPDDRAAVLGLHDRSSDESIYRRYFAFDREGAGRYAAHLVQPGEGRCALGAFADGELVGVGGFETEPGTGSGTDSGAHSGTAAAEFGLLVADAVQHTGIGTLLLEHLIAIARAQGVRHLIGDVLASNAPMLQVLHDLGFAATTRTEHGEARVEFGLELTQAVVAAISAREQAAEVASLRPLLAPRSVVVVGAGQRSGTVGHEVLRNILDAGFTGAVYAVNPRRDEVLGVRCVPTASQLPEAPDLAVVALPAAAVAEAVRGLGERGVRAVVLLGAGFGEVGPAGIALQDQVLALARAHGMRLVGPNCLGVVNTDPATRLDATFATLARRPGSLAVLAQSGAFGAALLAAAARVHLGVGQFVSIGNKSDVGGNDLLLAWDADPKVRVIAGYLESIGDPHRFVRIATGVTRHKPVLIVKSGRTAAGQAAGRSHTAAAASSDIAVDALLRASGVLRMRTMRELLDASRVLCDQPLPRGPRVAIVGNSGGPEILAADALLEAGLVVADLDPATDAALRQLGTSATNPLDLGAAVQPDVATAVLRTVLASASVDAVVSVFTDVAITDPTAMGDAVAAAAAGSDKPLLAVSVGGRSGSRELPGTRNRMPVFTFPEEAVAALGVAHRYGRLRAAPAAAPVRPAGIEAGAARAVVDAALRDGRDWLTTEDTHAVLTGYGIPVCPQAVVTGPDAAVAAATGLGYPLVAKLAAPGLHKTEMGGVHLAITGEAQLRAAVRELAGRSDGRVLLQPMIGPGTELIGGIVHDRQCGQLVMIGAGGVLTDVLDDRAFGLAPLTEHAADDLVAQLRASWLLDGYRGAPVVDRAAVRDLIVRLGVLADDLPAVAELDLNPIIARADGLHVVDARIRVARPPAHPDPLVRQLRGPRGTP